MGFEGYIKKVLCSTTKVIIPAIAMGISKTPGKEEES